MITVERRRINPNAKPPKTVSIDWLPNYFKDEDVFLLGSGPSLIDHYKSGLLKEIEKRRRIVINHGYMYVKPEILLFLDAQFKREFEQRGHDWSKQGRVLAGPTSGMKTHDNIWVFHIAQAPSDTPNWLFGRAQSGLVAINAALIGKAKRIFLLGFDCCFQKGVGHFYSSEWAHKRDHDEEAYKRGIEFYAKYYKHKNIFNCSPISRLKFPFQELKEIL